MTPADAVVRAHRLWVEGKRTGSLVFSYRHGALKRIEHQEVEFVDPPKSALGADGEGPPCPGCGQTMVRQAHSLMWACGPCKVKRTEAQLRAV